MFAFGLLLGAFGLAGCDRQESEYRPEISPAEKAKTELILGVHPLHNPQKLNRVFGPLVDYLSDNLDGQTVRLEASLDYPDFENKLYSRKFDLALPNPLQTIEAMGHGYSVFAKMGDDERFRGIILLRKDSPIQKIEDLRGKTIAYPAATALAGAMMPQAFLQANGLNVAADTNSIYVGSQESAIMNAVTSASDAGATWPPVWSQFQRENPELATQLEVRWQTPPLLNNSLMARDDLPAEVTAEIGDLLTSLHEVEEGQVILAGMDLSRFETASNETYDGVRTFVETFKETVRPLR